MITVNVKAQNINPTNHIIYVDSANTSGLIQNGNSIELTINGNNGIYFINIATVDQNKTIKLIKK